MSDERLKNIYAGVMDSRGRSAAADHPAPDALQALARREGDETGRLATLDHVMSCAACRADLDLLRSIEQAGAKLDTAQAPGRRRWFMPAALAASLLLAVAIGTMTLGRGADDLVRSGEEAGRSVALVAPGEAVGAGAPVQFAWHPVAGASRYRVELLTVSGDVAVEAETPDTTITLSAVQRLAPGSYRWWVLAMTPGSTSPRSALRSLELTR